MISSGVQIVLFVQGLGNWLEWPMRFFTFIGTQEFFLLFLPTLYWSIDSRLGLRVGFILLTGSMFNGLVKMSLAGPRPYWVSDKVRAFTLESSFGVPSNHAEAATGVWGTIAAHMRRAWVWAAAIAVIFLIGFSRIYLGVHFLHDVLLGWALGGLTLWAFTAWWERVSAWVKSLGFPKQVALAFGVSMAFVLAAGLIVRANAGYTLPEEWIRNIERAGGAVPQPFSMSGPLTQAGLLFGLSFGLAWMERRGGFRASGPLTNRVLCYVIGLLGLAILWFGLGEVLPRGDGLGPYVLRYLRYALVGAWVTGGAPWLFFRFNLVAKSGR